MLRLQLLAEQTFIKNHNGKAYKQVKLHVTEVTMRMDPKDSEYSISLEV